ncbi:MULTISPECIES: hypothetical protein [Actinokineospora]|uniref:Uncharacterized protein n=1 Tax=Actinokineospora fastidiosa TaxID=1816 RepID=A0A918LF08_9PSEU|nr:MULTISPECIES: hypothetical protein [Actinokineospora]UVS77798.1 hypothetical protein Actkin_01519 [Actinokineospora sp. UTMC 2448]GGS40916.1 hypothetical protein GCM10010171_39370 [Actinokineospora fastidiosa]
MRSERQSWLLPAVLLAVMVTAAGGLLARDLYAESTPIVQQPVVPSETPVPRSEQPGSRAVEGTEDAVRHPMYETVRQLLQTHFDAINGRNYERWMTTVTSAHIKSRPEPDWRAAYRSTQDGSVVVYRIESGPPDQARVMLGFVSTQDVADAPPELPEECIQWHVIYALAVENGAWRIDAGATGASPQHEAC